MRRFNDSLIASIVLVLLLGVSLFAQDAPKAELEQPAIVGPTESIAGVPVILRAECEGKCAWASEPEVKFFLFDEGKTLVFGSPDKQRVVFFMSALNQDDVVIVRHPLMNGDVPNPTPEPEPEPTPDPTQKYGIAFFYESNELDDGKFTDDQTEMFTSLIFRKELEANGHKYIGAFDVNGCANGKCSIVTKKLKPWFDVSAKFSKPCMVICPIGGTTYKAFQVPPSITSLYETIGGKQ